MSPLTNPVMQASSTLKTMTSLKYSVLLPHNLQEISPCRSISYLKISTFSTYSSHPLDSVSVCFLDMPQHSPPPNLHSSLQCYVFFQSSQIILDIPAQITLVHINYLVSCTSLPYTVFDSLCIFIV